jgi:hypothetical protein
VHNLLGVLFCGRNGRQAACHAAFARRPYLAASRKNESTATAELARSFMVFF